MDTAGLLPHSITSMFTLLPWLLLVGLSVPIGLHAADLFVSPTARPGGDGTSSAPFTTLEQARDLIRTQKRPLPGPVNVWLLAGTHFRTNTFQLEVQDSGSKEQPIVYRSRPGERARIVAGLPVKNWRRVSDDSLLQRLPRDAHDDVRVASLFDAGITEFGMLRPRGWGRGTQLAAAEVFFNGQPMTLARWPNRPEWARMGNFPGPERQPDGFGNQLSPISAGFTYTGDRPARWRDTTNIWTHGFWGWDWANSYERVGVLDPARRFVLNADPGGHFGFRPGNRFHFLNVFEELDSPGEYYIDTERGLLYIWPRVPVERSEVFVSLVNGDAIRCTSTFHLHLRGLVVEGARGAGIHLNQAQHCTIQECVVRNSGNWGVVVYGGLKDSVIGCDIHDTGDGGVLLYGGNRMSLVPGEHLVDNCRFERNGRWTMTYVPAVKLDGVGLVMRRCQVREHPHSAVWFEGNDHLIEGNEFSEVVTETGDVGAIYGGRNWTYRGTVIRNNFFHDFSGIAGWSKAVYLDDCLSGVEVVGNVFLRVRRAVHIAGGRDCRVENNVFAECEMSVDVDGRGMDNTGVWKAMRQGMQEEFKKIPYELYAKRYPALKTMAALMENGNGVPPEGNVVVGNVSASIPFLNLRWNVNAKNVHSERNVVGKDARVEIPGSGRPLVSSKSKAWENGFRAIPWNQIGLRDDASRRAVQKLSAMTE